MTAADMQALYDFLALPPQEVRKVCEISYYQDSGPGGQKRNRVLSAVRVKYPPLDLQAVDCETRTAARNLESALHKLRLQAALALPVEEELPATETWIGADGRVKYPTWPPFRLPINERHPDFPGQVLVALHLLVECAGATAEAGRRLGIGSAALIRFLGQNKAVWQKTQVVRRRFGLHPLHGGR